jgi:hypothetical protein
MNQRHLRAIIVWCLLLVQSVHGQFEPPPPRFSSVKDPGLRSALQTLFKATSDPSDVESLRRNLASPEQSKAIATILDTAKTSGTEGADLELESYFIDAIEAATISGSAVHVPALTILARHGNPALRRAVISEETLSRSAAPSVDVLRAAVLDAEARLPADLSDAQSSFHALKNFERCVKVFSRYAPVEPSEIQPIVDRVLARYDSPIFKSEYGQRFQEFMSVRPKTAGSPALQQREQAPTPSDQSVNATAGAESPADSRPAAHAGDGRSVMTWCILAALILAAIGGILFAVRRTGNR